MWKAGKLGRFLLVSTTASQWVESTIIRSLFMRMSVLQPLSICIIPCAFHTLAILSCLLIRIALFPPLCFSHRLISLIVLESH